MSVNKVILVGNLGRDPEVRTTSNGSKVVQLSIATSERWRDRATGEQREKTEWHRVVIFNERLADVADATSSAGDRSTSKASSRPASGRIRKATTNTPLRSCWVSTGASCR